MAAHRAASDHSRILTGSGFTAYQEGVRAEAIRNHDDIYEAAARMERGIRLRGKRFLFGADVAFLSRKIVRPMRHAADLQLASAQAMCVAYEHYCGTLGAPASKSGAFDETR